MDVLKQARKTNWNEMMGAILNRLVPIQTEFAKMQIEAGADVIGAGDSAVSQIGPSRYEDVCLKPTQRLFTGIKKVVPVLYHVCGNSAAVDKQGRDMLELVVKSGTSILDIDHQVDMASAKGKVGNRVCIRGNTDTSLLGSPVYTRAEVSDAIASTIEAGKPGGRYMFGAGCEWPWAPLELAIENLEIARSLVEKHGAY
jgi:uroporphyrinogen-III decarboxylase